MHAYINNYLNTFLITVLQHSGISSSSLSVKIRKLATETRFVHTKSYVTRHTIRYFKIKLNNSLMARTQ